MQVMAPKEDKEEASVHIVMKRWFAKFALWQQK